MNVGFIHWLIQAVCLFFILVVLILCLIRKKKLVKLEKVIYISVVTISTVVFIMRFGIIVDDGWCYVREVGNWSGSGLLITNAEADELGLTDKVLDRYSPIDRVEVSVKRSKDVSLVDVFLCRVGKWSEVKINSYTDFIILKGKDIEFISREAGDFNDIIDYYMPYKNKLYRVSNPEVRGDRDYVLVYDTLSNGEEVVEGKVRDCYKVCILKEL